MKENLLVMPKTTTTTCEKARELSKQPGVRIFWRPGGVINWMLPELDAAQVLED
jgi:hypothetical protein